MSAQSPRKLLLFPFGGNAREALLSLFALNERSAGWDLLGFIDDDPGLRGRECCGVKVLGGRELLEVYPEASLLAVPGSPKGYLRRKTVIESLPVERSRFATILHPSVVKAPDALVGYNTLIMSHAVVSCGARIGNHCVILPNTVVSHDSVVEDYCCIGANVSISGQVALGAGCYIGSGSKIRENVRIGARALIGLGSNVIADIDGGVVAVGNPAAPLRKHP